MKQICNEIQQFGARLLLLAVMIFAGQNAWGQTISFTETATAGSLNGKIITNESFSLTITDVNSKISVDENTAYFGTSTDNKIKFDYRLKTGGKSDSKNKLTLSIPTAGILIIYARTGSNAATDRNVVVSQNDNVLLGHTVLETECIVEEYQDPEQGTLTRKIYTPLSVNVDAGTVTVTYPNGSINFYGFNLQNGTAPGDGEEYGSGGGSGALVLGEDMTEQALAGYFGKTLDAQLQRTFYKDGGINTICLPFSLTEEQLAESPLKGYAKLQRVSSASVKDAGYDSQSLDLTLTDVTSIEAGVPYIISWTEGEDGEDIVDPLFEDVTITTAGPAQTASTGGVAFRGTFTPKSVTAGDKGVMFVGSDGQISWPETDDVIKGFRCWFSIDK